MNQMSNRGLLNRTHDRQEILSKLVDQSNTHHVAGKREEGREGGGSKERKGVRKISYMEWKSNEKRLEEPRDARG